MATNPDIILDIARPRLKFTGNVTIQVETSSENLSPEFGFVLAAAGSNDDASQHTIKYIEGRLDDSGLFHELCHVKLNEIGFKKVEADIEPMLSGCKNHKERETMKKAVVFIAEVYANFLLFRYFKEASKSDRAGLDSRFLVASAIRIIVRDFGYLGIISAAGHRISKRWNGYDDDDVFNWTFKQAFKGKSEYKIYTKIHSILSKLPLIRECDGEIQIFTNKEIDLIKECVLMLVKNQD